MAPIEIQAIEILKSYTGFNNQILDWKSIAENNEKFVLSRTQAEYIVKYHDIKPKVARKFVKIEEYIGKKMMEDRLFTVVPEQIWVEKILAESDKAYHFMARITESSKMEYIWIPKSMVIRTNNKEVHVDFEKYNVRPPLPHQKEAIITLLKNDKFILADDMGAGKSTSATIASLESGSKKILIICPATLKINWKREILIYTNEPVYIVEGKNWEDGYKYYIINYDILKNFHQIKDNKKKKSNEEEELTEDEIVLKNHILHGGFELIIIDEAHYIQNKDSLRTKLINDICNNIKKLWLLTGTPITSRPINYYNLLKLIDCPLAFNWTTYVKRYCKGYQFKIGNRRIWNVNGASNLDELRERTKPYVLRRLKEDILDLPDKIITPIYLEMKSRRYEEEMGEYYKWNKKEGKDTSIAVQLNKLMAIRQIISQEKIPYTIELIEKMLEMDKKVIVFTNFTETLEIIAGYFKGKAVQLDGRMTAKKKQESVDRFQTDPKVKIFVSNLKAGGVGITLTEAEAVIMNDLSFVPGEHSQGEDRCVFKGQKVLTNEGFKKIEDILLGDQVYTHKGNFKTVIDKTTKLERQKLKYDFNYFGYCQELSVTEDHKIFVFNKITKKFEWKEAKEIRPDVDFFTLKCTNPPVERKKFIKLKNDDFLTFQNNFNVETKNGRLNILPNEVELTNDLLFSMGWYVAEGWCNNDNSKKSCNVSICGNLKTESEKCEKIINVISQSFNLPKINKYESKNKNGIQYAVYSKQLANHFKEWFGSGSHNKQFPNWVYELNEEQLKSLLEGYYEGDGYKRLNYQTSSSVSNKLSSQLVILNARLKRIVSLCENKKYYHFQYLINPKKNRILLKDDYLLFPIEYIKISKPKRNGNERVYDLTIEEDHSFVVGMTNVHNCYRYGQKKNISVYYPIFENTIETIMYNILGVKKNIIDTVMGDNIEYSSGFGTDLIKQLKG